MTNQIRERVKKMIDTEVSRKSLVDLCNHWEVSVDDYYNFLEEGDNKEKKQDLSYHNFLEQELKEYQKQYDKVCYERNKLKENQIYFKKIIHEKRNALKKVKSLSPEQQLCFIDEFLQKMEELKCE